MQSDPLSYDGFEKKFHFKGTKEQTDFVLDFVLGHDFQDFASASTNCYFRLLHDQVHPIPDRDRAGDQTGPDQWLRPPGIRFKLMF